MLRLALALMVRMGLTLLVMAVLIRLVPMPTQADVMADDFAIALCLLLVLGPACYLRLTRDTAGSSREPGETDATNYSRARRQHEKGIR